MTTPTPPDARARLATQAAVALTLLALAAAVALAVGLVRYARAADAVQGMRLTLTAVQPALAGNTPTAALRFRLHNTSPLPLFLATGKFDLWANGLSAGDSSRGYWGSDPANDPGPLQHDPALPMQQVIGPGQTLEQALTLHLIPAHVATIRQAQRAGPVVWTLHGTLQVMPAFAAEAVPLSLAARLEADE